MSSDPDRYDAWYAAKLWSLLPAIYRAEDSTDFDRKGPLQELVDRIGAQTAIVRRSIDRLWEDQSIETCDDWVIDYLGDLLATNLVASLDARGRRLDVFKTIKYRRRKGTVGLLEELATDITGWSACVVEFFHRLGRTRHGLDPAIGHPAKPEDLPGQLQRAQRLVGARTRTGAGGFADLRDVHGATLTNSAFDEYAHTADVRRGRGRTGWHDIPRLGVFVWRLRSLRVRQVTPVADKAFAALPCKQYTFDPTGRDVPLFAAGEHPFGDQWISPMPQDVPGPIAAELLDVALPDLYPRSLALYHPSVPGYELVPSGDLADDRRDPKGKPWIDPARGRIICPVTPPEPFRVDFHYGFSSEIGAGPYERPVRIPPPDEAPLAITEAGNPATMLGIPSTGAVVIVNSLTYPQVAPLAAITRVELRAKNQERPLLRLDAGATWTLTGTGAAASLLLDGLFVSGGGDLVLSGTFDQVTLSCCTLDPGTWDAATHAWATAADGRPLAPTRLRIQGSIRELVLDRCITGPTFTEGAGRIEHLTIRESIVQAARPGEAAITLAAGEVALSRTTVLGAAQVHRLDASECILHEVVTVDDCQHGCVRFTAFATGSTLPRQYESVAVPPRAALFGSRRFGQPDYAQLVAAAGPAIAEGAEDGSEMGAFWRERCAIKERSLLIKYQEYLPLGLEPVVIHAT
jgi:hypothetical protein